MTVAIEPAPVEEEMPVEEVVSIEPEPVQEITSVDQAPEEPVSEEPQPVEEVAIAEPEPVQEVVQEPVQEVSGETTQEDTVEKAESNEETTSADIESTDSNQEGYPIIVKVSHYNPSLGGPNCASFVNGECLSKMSNGERWQDYWGEYNTIACPWELPFGTVISLDGNEFTCRDRGGAIVITWEGYYWIDILAESVPYFYGELREAYILK